MQAVILAAGRGTRMKELTKDLPKPLLEVNGKTLLEYQFDALPETVDEVFVIVGYKSDVIRQKYGESYKGRKIFYIDQDVLDGTAGALWRAQNVLKGRFIVLMADDMYARRDIEKCMEEADWAMLVQRRAAIKSKGKVEVDENNNILAVAEGNHGDTPGLLGTNCFLLDTRVFEHPLVPKTAGSDEFGLPQTVIAAAAAAHVPFKAVEGSSWLEITDPEDLKKAEDILSGRA